jgi:pimeloyl-ACP methyl ester carboxylesterase/DNA-binding winged helix-turn-helix (wHTH) protein
MATMIFRFGDYELDLNARELHHGRELVHVEPQVFDLLGWLIANRDRAVTKEELFEEIWRGRVVSDATLSSRINAARQAIGDSGSAQRSIRTLPRHGFRFVAPVISIQEAPSSTSIAVEPACLNDIAPSAPQVISFCRSHDGLKLAIARSGSGLPVVKSGTWLTNVEKDWTSALWSPLYTRLASEFELIRYDPRGCGLSEWDAAEISFERFVDDLEAVVNALQLEKFALLGISQGAAVSIAYAARHPDRVSRLALSGAFPLGWRKRGSQAEIATREAVITLLQNGWGQDNAALRQVYDLRMWPDATPEQLQSLNELQRLSTSPDNAVRILRAVGEINVVPLLSQVSVPTLVLHSRSDATNPVELGSLIANGIPGARFIKYESRNHIPLENEPTWNSYLRDLCGFLHGG